jgi:hypothetical protein
MAFKPKRIEEPGEGDPLPPRPSSKELAAALAPIASTLIPTAPSPPAAAAPPPAPEPTPPPAPAPTPAPVAKPLAEPVLMMSFKASKPFAKMLAEAAEGEGGLRRLIARVFYEAGYPVPPSELQPQRRRRTYD